MKTLFTTLALCLFLTGVAVADPASADATKPVTVRTFQLKFKDADRAATIVKALLSPEGSMSIQPSTNALVVTDRADNIRTIGSALTDFDVAPRPVKVTMRLVSASKTESAGPPRAEVRDVGSKLAVLGYNLMENLGEANVEGHEGEPGSFDLPSGYRAEFKFGELDTTTDSIKLSDFRLSKLQKDQLSELYKASFNVKINQPLIFGVTKTQGQRALFLVFVAHR